MSQKNIVDQLSAILKLLTDEQKQQLAQQLELSAQQLDKETTVVSDEHQAIQKIKRNKVRSTQIPETKKPCRSEPITLNKKENKFFEIKDVRGNKLADSCRKDSQIDKILLKNVVPQPRIRSTNVVAVECCVCGETVEVNADTILDINNYKCNDCITR